MFAIVGNVLLTPTKSVIVFAVPVDTYYMLHPPTEQEIFNFVSSTHAADRINLTSDQIQNTWSQKGLPNPYAQGHFRAHMYVVNQLLPSSDFPAKGVGTIKSVGDSHSALFWLRDMHQKVTLPLVGHPFLDDDVNAPRIEQVGKYRMVPTMAVDKPAPPSDLIPRLMHNWLVQYASFHDKIKGKIDNPYGMDKETALDIYKHAYEVNLFFCVVQPMSCLNQRMGRLLENTFRIAWRLPMKIYTPQSTDYRNLPSHIKQFQDESLPNLVTACSSVRG